MIKPYRTLLLLLLVHGLLGIFIFLFPSGSIFLFNDFNIKFVSLDDLLHHKEVKYADIQGIIKEESNLNIDSAVEKNKGAVVETAKNDSLAKDSIANIQALLNLRYKIEYPEGQPELLQPFFAELDALATQKRLVRIIHYGDSEIEGDRITGTLRDKMQTQFGGCGAGTVPVFDVSDIRSSIGIKCSNNWKKFAIYGGLYKGVHTKNYGMQGAFFRILGAKDTTGAIIPGPKQAWVSFHQSSMSYAGTRKFEEVTLYYANVTAPVRLRIYQNKTLILTDSISSAGDFNHKTWPIDSLKGNLKIEFYTTGNIDVYGFGFDCKRGVAVDNVSMRGSSGLDFNRIEPAYLAQQLWTLNTKLVILEFGVNVAPNELENYDFYEKAYYNELKRFRDNMPGVSILVVGISDMSSNKDGNYVTAPNIQKIRDAQKRAAFRAGCAFWDLFEAMGGENSMPSWVNAKPALAQKDYTHFSAPGAKIVGGMLYNALMSDYLAYKTHAQR